MELCVLKSKVLNSNSTNVVAFLHSLQIIVYLMTIRKFLYTLALEKNLFRKKCTKS